jgi:peroxiredoxin
MATSERSTFFLAALALAAAGCATVPRAALPLLRLDGAAVSTAEVLEEGEATVFVFWASACPCVRRYQARVEALRDAVAKRGVRVVGISSNAGETAEDVQRTLAARGASLEVLRDEGGALAEALGARSTPTVVLVRKDGAVLYRGWLDNERLPGEPGRVAWLEQAVAAFTEGRPGPTTSKTFGCTITRRLGAPGGTCHVPAAEVAAASAPTP